MFTIRKPEILRRLVNRYGIEPLLTAGGFLLSHVIVPITDADELLQTPGVANATTDISAAVVYLPIFVVPKGKRWRLLAIHRAGTTGTSRVRVTPAPGLLAFRMGPGATGESTWFAGTDKHYVEEGGDVGMDTTNNGADTAIQCQVWYLEEDAH